MRNFFTTNKPLEPKKIPHSGPSEPQPDEESAEESAESQESNS